MQQGERRGARRAGAILDATLTLLAERGYDGLTIEGVAARSGVNKTTIYRWWPSKDRLLGAALLDSALVELEVPDTGSLRGDLRELVRHVTRLLTEEPVASVATAALTAFPRRPELAEIGRAFFADRLSREAAIFRRAVARGEIADDVDPALVVDLLGGAVWARVMLRQEPVPVDFADRVVDAVLSGVMTR